MYMYDKDIKMTKCWKIDILFFRPKSFNVTLKAYCVSYVPETQPTTQTNKHRTVFIKKKVKSWFLRNYG